MTKATDTLRQSGARWLLIPDFADAGKRQLASPVMAFEERRAARLRSFKKGRAPVDGPAIVGHPHLGRTGRWG